MVLHDTTSLGYLLLSIPTEFTPHIEHVGGTIKWGVATLGQSGKSQIKKDVLRILTSCVVDDNLTFGLTLWDKAPKASDFMMRDIKKDLSDYSVRFLPSSKLISSRTLRKNKLIESSTDISVFIHGDNVYIGQTKEVQDVDAYTARDVGRPDRPLSTGIMPPKLAQMMINLAQVNNFHALLLDPFCGSGTVLQEAHLMGYKNLMGSDADHKAIDYTSKNLAWFKIPPEDFKLSQCDARKIGEKIPGTIGAVVTEPYLGPHREHADSYEIARINDELSSVYQGMINSVSTKLIPHGRIVMVFPRRSDTNRHTSMPFVNTKNLGLIELPSFIHYREGQNIARVIRIFEKV